ncbi:hypothetical protein ACQ4PT_067748 [Festuca glaucescens]
MADEMDLGSIVISWSVQEIIDDDLYRGQVEAIPCTFTSLDHYFKSYRAPLLEETRSDLCSGLELIAEAPSSRILSMEAAGKPRLYSMDVDFLDNGADSSTDSYTARNGDIFILSNMKPEAAAGFSRYGVIYCLAMVTEVSVDNDCRKGFKIKVPKDIDVEQDSSKLKHAIFLSNIMTNIWIWKALCFHTHMDNNFTVIKSLLAPTNTGHDVCGICVKQDGNCLSSFLEQLLSISLNQSQVDAIRSVILAVQCKHMNLTKLIWGPPGAGKTKMVSALLWVCKEAGFGTSLFQRLVMLKFEKHLLNMQYRMDPCIGLFPIAQFYKRKILDGPNVVSPLYNKEYASLPFGSYTFINIVDGREDKEGTRNSWRNMVEVAVVLHLIHTIFKCMSKLKPYLIEPYHPNLKPLLVFNLIFSWERSGQGLSIGVVSAYSSQVDEIRRRLGKKYDTCDSFRVRIKSIDGFQGQEDDVIILSTVRSNGRGAVGFLADNQRTNVALTRARHGLWIVGDANTLSKSGTVWTDIVDDAKRRNCIFSATNDATMHKLILQVKQDLGELDDLLNADSAFFSNTRWKVILSDKFRKSFTELKSRQLRREVLQKLVKLGAGWRTKFKNVGIRDTFQLAKVWKIRDLYLIWSTDLEKSERRKLEVPLIWDVEHNLVHYKKDCAVNAQKDNDLVDRAYAMENSEVTESFLLMKFYSLSSGMAKC